MKRKVSIDFDSTLSRRDVQIFVSSLMEDFEVWIVTSRPEKYVGKYKNYNPTNDDLFEVADRIGILRENIAFTNHADKIKFLLDKNFLFHLDDDIHELIEIMRSNDSCKPINVDLIDYEEVCKEIINYE
jgi:hypothetical protein